MGLFGIFGNKKTSLIGSEVLMGARDSHTHILPGVDDGVQTLAQSLEILAFVETVGITELWCTPHIMDDVPNRTEALKERFSGLCAAYRGPIKLRLAAEYMLDQEYEERLANDDILTMDNDIVLVETSANVPPYNLLDILENTLSKGYRPMMAHPERNRYMEMADYRHLKDLGVLFQLNLYSLMGYYGETAMKKSRMLLKDGWYDAVGSDCHRMGTIVNQYNKAELPKEVVKDLETLLQASRK